MVTVERHSLLPESRNNERSSRHARWQEPRSGGGGATLGKRHGDRARSPASRRPTPDAPAGRRRHNRARGGLHRCCAYSHRPHSQSVKHASPSKARPDADLVHGWPPSRLMPSQMGQQAGTVHMQPMKHAIHADPSLISMLESAGRDQIRNALHRRSQALGGQFAPLDQARVC